MKQETIDKIKMAQTFKIQPGDQSLVGKKVRGKEWPKDSFIILKYIGKQKAFVEHEDGSEGDWIFSENEWEFYEEPKKKVLMAPAIIRNTDGSFYLTTTMFPSLKDAEDRMADSIVSWPAIPNKDGFYEVPE